ncbi:hypothetical protein O181_046506 [Austropuccinia psidii MF-1]|uniref:Uncharacterized protein n=1 Tax=Austropuccinia psidii MF-1 TaxID=1389203 RepID=A0A9Q3DM26_9BASI|nr:hypothetical protein [Austropuccinia psidii MF-1]
MLSWLKWFLALESIEDSIESWSQEVFQANNDCITDIQNGNGWKELSWDSTIETNDTLRLCFSLFEDWFNPWHNKLSGKQESMGIVSLSCLNLPPSIWHKLPHLFIVGIMPGPQAPNMTTISDLLTPLVDDLLQLKDPIRIPTFKRADGCMIHVCLLTVVGDTGATHKLGGFASHSAKYFCTWCLTTDSKITNLQCGKEQEAQDTREQGDQWKHACKNQQNVLLCQSGVQYSELNQLAYRDPVKHVSLGMMHNWMEGILSHHFWK